MVRARDSAANHGGVADLQFVFHREPAGDLTGDDRLVRLNIAVPTAGDRQIQTAFQLAVAMHFARDDERAGAADVPDDDGLGADKGRGRRVALRRTGVFVRS